MNINIKASPNAVPQPIAKTHTKKESSVEENSVNSSNASSIKLSFESALSSIGHNIPMNHDKIAQLKQAIANGSYQVNSKELAANIIKTEVELTQANI